LNRYAYAENNPVSKSDPKGHDVSSCDTPDTGCDDPFATQTHTARAPAAPAITSDSYIDPETAADYGINVFANQDVPSAPSDPSITDGYGNDCTYDAETCADEGIVVFASQLDAIPVTSYSLPAVTSTVAPSPPPTQTTPLLRQRHYRRMAGPR